MKFAKRYIDDIKEKQPGWRDKLLSYKELKRLVRRIGDDGNSEAEFMCLLNNEIDKFNEFFIEKEEEFIIRQKELEQNMKTAINLWRTNGSNPSEKDDKNKLIKDIVDLHGEMSISENNGSEPNECLSIKHTRWHDEVQFGIKALRLVLEMVSFRSCWCVKSDLKVPYLYEKVDDDKY
ncbi:SPX domain-containing protein 3-like [Trifolium pratense]|uniref:SPX domain-containing protein 3-like n=1 Tax=Trifolium pratense TaxID=57577 RepID=UPI001E6908C4|nr:SPX domain-containing protein 3-like [Trifolium pratense]